MDSRGADPPLQVSGLRKRYGDRIALDGVSLTLHEGEIFGFVGGNGAGKTTTMRIILGVLAADSGAVQWNGAPITFADRRHIGYMPEERGLYPTLGVLEQLIYFARLHGVAPEAARQSAGRWLERFGLTDRGADQLQKLSHGNQQRVELAAALVHDPDVLILDEPFAGLDPVAVDAMAGVLRECATQGKPVLFSSHQLDIVEGLCDRVGIIRAGTMVAAGTITDLQHAGPARYWLEVADAPAEWWRGVPGATVVQRHGSRTLVELRPETDPQAILSAALKAGSVLEFRRDVPPLSEVFRQAMAAPQ